MFILKVIVLAIIQGLAELLPVSSSAHVVVAEKLMGLDPAAPQMTLLLVMLHTGTMFAVILFFWKLWKESYFASLAAFTRFAGLLVWATIITAVVGEAIKKLIEHTLFRGTEKAEIEQLFGRLDLIAPALAGAGMIILLSGFLEKRQLLKHQAMTAASPASVPQRVVTFAQASWMGIVQGVALPFRGFSRSGSTISAGMLVGAPKDLAERFSFAMAVVLTPAVIAMEALRLHEAVKHASPSGVSLNLRTSIGVSVLGMVFSFLAGLLALKWLSSWLESGRWYLFGIYCLIASGIVFYLHRIGF